jgi:hypothetical protein
MALKRSTLLAAVMLTYTGSVEAQSYLCIADRATGFRFDKPTKRWLTAQFDVADHKYTLSQKDDEWTWAMVGKNPLMSCTQKKEAFSSVGAFKYEFGLSEEVLMNRNTLRFQIMSPYLYVGPFEKDEEGADAPYIEIGRCAVVK